MSRIPRTTAAVLGVASVLAAPAAPAAAHPGRTPVTIELPAGFQPEGLAVGPGAVAYTGSYADGRILRIDLRTGRTRQLAAATGTSATGLKVVGDRLFVAGGTGGDARVLDARTGRLLAHYQLATGTSFVNDVVVTPEAAWFTDSLNPVLYRVPSGGGAVRTVPITGDLTYADGFNANGIARTPDGRGLLVAQTNTGRLFRVDPATGRSTAVDLGGRLLPTADGILLDGRDLYVAQNTSNLLSHVRLDRAGTRGRFVGQVADPRFDVPTAVGIAHGRGYVVNARFDVTPTPATSYTVVALPLP